MNQPEVPLVRSHQPFRRSSHPPRSFAARLLIAGWYSACFRIVSEGELRHMQDVCKASCRDQQVACPKATEIVAGKNATYTPPQSQKSVSVRETKEFRIDVEQLNRATNDANAVSDHAFCDGVAVEQQERNRTLFDRCRLGVRRKPARCQENTVIVIALDRATKLVDFGAAHRVLPPPFCLKRGANRHDALPKKSVTIDSTVGTSTGNLKLVISERPEKGNAEPLEFGWLQAL